MQVLSGPRQAGKTTLAMQAIESSGLTAHYATADDPGLRDPSWIESQWEVARALEPRGTSRDVLLVLDEVQKVAGWSETLKRRWDADRRSTRRLRVLILGSAPLRIQRGLSESLAGRFEVIPVPHWSFPEMSTAFGWTLEQYLFYGGYPGAAPLVADPPRWRAYIFDSLIETTISRDVLLLTRVDKPALLRQLFRLGCDYSGQILSYQKMLGQLQDAGNTTTLAHYLELLLGSGLVAGLPKYSGSRVRQRGSIPKLLVLNTALMTATSGISFEEAQGDREYWGRLVESAVGAHLVNTTLGSPIEVSYWRERNQEVDFVLSNRRELLAIEVKSGTGFVRRDGLAAFGRAFPRSRKLLVGGNGLPVRRALEEPATEWLERSQRSAPVTTSES